MTSDRQVAANRRNARLSTGPRTLEGKARSCRNAVRHGLTAEVVIGVLEQVEDYERFETAILADHAPRSALERELVGRLISLLWRLRRAGAIEAGLLQIQAGILEARRRNNTLPPTVTQFIDPTPETRVNSPDPLDLARAFLRLANIDGLLLERLGGYEQRLWRQTRETLQALREIQSPRPR